MATSAAKSELALDSNFALDVIDEMETFVNSSHAGELSGLFSAQIDLYIAALKAPNALPAYWFNEQVDGHLFYRNMQPDAHDRIDSCGIIEVETEFLQAYHHHIFSVLDLPEIAPPPNDIMFSDRLFADQFTKGWKKHAEQLLNDIIVLFDHKTSRPDSESCDEIMVTLSIISRFLSMWTYKAEQLADQDSFFWKNTLFTLEEHSPASTISDAALRDCQALLSNQLVIQAKFLEAVPTTAFCWEALINTAIIGWEENRFDAFHGALTELLPALEAYLQSGTLPNLAEGASEQALNGYPIRAAKQNRLKISLEVPARDLRGGFVVSYKWRKFKDSLRKMPEDDADIIEPIALSMQQFITQTEQGCYWKIEPTKPMLAQIGGKAIRAPAKNHPFLLAPESLLKRALLLRVNPQFQEPEGYNHAYLLLRQLQRCLLHPVHKVKHHALLQSVRKCQFQWEENRCCGFAEQLLQLATRISEINDDGNDNMDELSTL